MATTMPVHFIPGTQPPTDTASPAWWLPFIGRQLLFRDTPKITFIQESSLKSLGLEPIRTQYLGLLNNYPCYTAELPHDTLVPPQMALKGLRDLYGILDEDLLDLGGLAFQIMEWDRTHQFCGHCGTPTDSHPLERAKRCPNCGLSQYPRISPAMIVLIYRGDEILLGRAPRFRPGMYSLIAGYVEANESLEACVRREVHEEVGVDITHIRYWGSQPWPYPHTLMVGFTAEYAGGDIRVDPEELTDAGWFSVKDLPVLPSSMSIAWKMIDWFVQQHGGTGLLA